MDMDKNNYKIVILSDRKVLEKHHVSYDHDKRMNG